MIYTFWANDANTEKNADKFDVYLFNSYLFKTQPILSLN